MTSVGLFALLIAIFGVVMVLFGWWSMWRAFTKRGGPL